MRLSASVNSQARRGNGNMIGASFSHRVSSRHTAELSAPAQPQADVHGRCQSLFFAFAHAAYSEAASPEIPGYLSREVNTRTVLLVSHYARGGLTRLEAIVYGSLTGAAVPRRRGRLAWQRSIAGLCPSSGMPPSSDRQLAKIRHSGLAEPVCCARVCRSDCARRSGAVVITIGNWTRSDRRQPPDWLPTVYLAAATMAVANGFG